ncbi:MAG TPA: efflux RND transporter permease subunit [Lacunisphaera sp.]|jgi:CzcA family heavy metal efflux pump|nr:efflux RND transporter permease subunit [Lacunisphaera sp.]
MLQSIVQFSLRFRRAVVSLAVLGLGYGVYVAQHAKLDVFPDFVPPEVTVQVEAPGLAPEQVEQLVTRPIEAALNGLGHQESIRSESIQGLAVVTVVFQEGTDTLAARQLLAEKLAETAGTLPTGVKAPKMSPLTSATMDLLKIGLVSDRLSPMELRTFADWTLKPRLLAVTGVAHCNIFGGEVRQWQIQVHPDQLVAHNLDLSDVLAAARLASGIRGAGFIDTPNQRILLQTEGQTLTPAELGAIVVVAGPGGVPVRLRDVATVTAGAEPKFGDALVQGRPGVLLTMTGQYGANTMEVTAALEAALAELRPVLTRAGITLYPALHRPATFIEASLRNIRHSLLLGAALVAVVLFLFLGHVRTALISLTAIPLSLLGAVVVLNHFGGTLNTITLGGLAIAIGEVVDDAIIDVENILRRLRLNAQLERPQPALAVILAASLEVRQAIVFATFIVALVFLPVLTLTGLQGSFFAPLAASYLLAILTSLVVALTVTPALTLLFFSRGAKAAEAPRLQAVLRRRYERILGWVARHPGGVIGLVALVCLLALSRLPFLGGEFLPEFREGHFVLGVSTAPGASLAETMRLGREISTALLRIDQVATVEQQIGRAEQGEDTWPPHRSEFHVELKPGLPGREQARVEDEIRDVLRGIPGIQFEVLTFLGDRIGETIGGETAPVVINLFGENLDELDAKAREVQRVLADLPADDVQVKSPPGAPRLAIRLRPDRLTALGFRPVEVLETVQAAWEGAVVAQVYQENQSIDVAVMLDPAHRRDPEAVGDLLLTSATGRRVPLRVIADIYLTDGRSSILHEGARRRQTVTCSPPTGRDVGAFVAEARAAIARKVSLPAGMYVEYAGAAEARRAATRELLLRAVVAGAGIVLLLSVVLGHWRNVALVLVNLPLALTGGVLAVYAAGLFGADRVLTMGSLVGFVTLFGITTRNAIMLLSHYEHLVRVDGLPWNTGTAILGASERLVPIMMTATVTALGLLPLALGSGEAGREIEGPMAIVILGGLFTSATLNLLVLPVLALRWARWRDRGATDES